MKCYFKCKIISATPFTEYENRVFEQITVIELPNGLKFGLFDNGMQIKPNMIGKEKDIAVSVLPYRDGIKVLSKSTQKVVPSQTDPYHYEDHKYYGQVEKVDVKDIWHPAPSYRHLACINAGLMNILVSFDELTSNNIKEGDYIEIRGLMSFLKDVKYEGVIGEPIDKSRYF